MNSIIGTIFLSFPRAVIYEFIVTITTLLRGQNKTSDKGFAVSGRGSRKNKNCYSNEYLFMI